MCTKILPLLLGLAATVIAPQVIAKDLTPKGNAFPSEFVDVKADSFFNSTGIYASPGESFLIKAKGKVDISKGNGSYRTKPDGTIVMTPPPDSGAFEFFRDRAGPLDTDPVRGSRKSFLQLTSDLPGHLPGSPYGALVAGFSQTSSPSTFNDFPNGFALVGTYGIARAPNTGGYLFLGVNDFNNPGGDNAGAFQVRVFRLGVNP
jgi:hypothetical protein